MQAFPRTRTVGTFSSIAILLCVFSVSYESEVWSFWGEAKANRKVKAEKYANQPGVDFSWPSSVLVGAVPVQHGSTASSEKLVKGGEKNELVGVLGVSNLLAEKEEVQVPSISLQSNKSTHKDAPLGIQALPELVPSDGKTEPPALDRVKSITKEEQEHAVEEATAAQQHVPVEALMKASDDHDGIKGFVKETSYVGDISRKSKGKTFMVVFMGHSGSTAFTTELRTHSEFHVELLEPLDHGKYAGNTDLALQRARELFENGIAKGKIPGFKIRPYHILNNQEAWRKIVQEYDTRIFWQFRENKIKQAVGEYRRAFLNDSSVIEGLRKNEEPCAKDSDQKCVFRIENMRGLLKLMNDFTANDELLASAARALHRDDDLMLVKYEDYLYRRERTMRETFNFLGVDYQDTAAQRQKASPDNLCEMVSNFQVLCDRFLPCQLWRPYLSDDLNNCRCMPGSWRTFDPIFCKRAAWYQNP